MIQIKPEAPNKHLKTGAVAEARAARKPVTKKAGNVKPIPVTIPVTKRGRPPTGNAMTNAERQAKFKALKKAHGASNA